MSKKYVAALTVGLAIPAFALSRVIWPDPPGAPAPPPGLLPFLIVPSAVESLAFGAGVAFLVAAGRGLIGNPRARGLALAAYFSAGWALVSWWPHSNMHRVNTTFQGLVLIDWTFHLTLIAGALIIGVFLYRTVSEGQVAERRDRGDSTRLLDAGA
jgi:hypothetical protein